MKFLKKLTPPEMWQLPGLIAAGVFFGLGFFSIHISKAPSYLGDKSETCINCHIMAPYYVTWYHSSHRHITNCNDCHVPHNNFINKYYFKARDGLRHATIFTLRKEPQVIFIKDEGREAVHNNCIRCHSDLLTDSRLLSFGNETHKFRTERNCIDCHREVPHGRVNSLSSVPYARVPLPGSIIPEWIQNIIPESPTRNARHITNNRN